jgi:hypothetical protein
MISVLWRKGLASTSTSSPSDAGRRGPVQRACQLGPDDALPELLVHEQLDVGVDDLAHGPTLEQDASVECLDRGLGPRVPKRRVCPLGVPNEAMAHRGPDRRMVPLSLRGQCGFKVLSTADTRQSVSSSRTSADLRCSLSAADPGRPSVPRAGEGAGCKKRSSIAGRAVIVSLDVPFHRRADRVGSPRPRRW